MKTLLLLGAGHAHLFVLEEIARSRQGSDPKNAWPTDWRVQVLTPSLSTFYSGMVPGHVEGRYDAQACQINVTGLMEAAQAQWVEGSATAIDAEHQVVRYASAHGDGQLAYELLSVNVGGSMNRDRMEVAMPGSRRRAMFARPMEQLVNLWPRLLKLARGAAEQAELFRIAVIGGGAAGIELALTLRAAVPMASITLLAGEMGAAAGYPARFRKKMRAILAARSVQVLDDRCVGMNDGYLLLSSGATLSCDAPLVVTGSQSPAWLADSAGGATDAPASLALDGQGFIVVNAFQQSLNQPRVFAAGDVASRADKPHPRSGVYAVHAGPALATNLLRAMRGEPLKRYAPPAATLNLLNCGDGTALAHYGAFGMHWVAHGAWVMRWKDRIDRRFVARFSMG